MDKANPHKDNMAGKLLLGRYRIVRKLASGGMGVVYLARSEGAAGFVKPVVVKLILPTFASRRDFAGMFVREASILANLRDPGIVNVIEFGEEDGCYIMVLEYVHGYQLREWIKYLRSKRRVIPTDIAVHVVISVLDALQHAHTIKDSDGKPLNVVHRDISPANIMIDKDGHIKLVDFGIARMTGGEQSYQSQVGSFKGKLAYSAPELFASKGACVQSDVYACGVTLHELLVGKNEFRTKDHASTVRLVLEHALSPLVNVRKDVVPAIDKIIQKATAKNAADRYQTALEFSAALRDMGPYDDRKAKERLSLLAGKDFGQEMADFLGMESLDRRETAWRHPSVIPSGDTTMTEADGSLLDEKKIVIEESKPKPVISPPPAPPVPPSAKPAPGSGIQKHIIWALVAVVLIGAVVGVYFISQQRPRKQPPKVVVVQSPVDEIPSTAEDQQKDKDSSATEPETQETTPAPVTSEPKDKTKTKVVRRAAKEPSTVVKLTRAFKKRKGRIHSCIKQHAGENSRQSVSIKFTVLPSGNVKSASIVPASENSTPLGGCLLKVANSTKFPPQEAEVTFKIPLRISSK